MKKTLLLATTIGVALTGTGLALDRDGNGVADSIEIDSGRSSMGSARSAEIAVVDAGDAASHDALTGRLDALGFAVTSIPSSSDLSSLVTFQVVVLPAGHAQSSDIVERAADYIAYVGSGGALWVNQPNPLTEPAIDWVPYPLSLSPEYPTGLCFSNVVDPEHCITMNAGSLRFSFAFDTVTQMGSEWTTLAQVDSSRPALLIAAYGVGRILVDLGNAVTYGGCPTPDAALARYASCLLQGPVGVAPTTWGTMKAFYREPQSR